MIGTHDFVISVHGLFILFLGFLFGDFLLVLFVESSSVAWKKLVGYVQHPHHVKHPQSLGTVGMYLATMVSESARMAASGVWLHIKLMK